MTEEQLATTLKGYWTTIAEHTGGSAFAAFHARVARLNVDIADVRKVCDELALTYIYPSEILPRVFEGLKDLHNDRAPSRNYIPSRVPMPAEPAGPTIAENIRAIAAGTAEPRGGWTRGEYQGAVRLAAKHDRDPRLGDLLWIRHSNQERQDEIEREERIAQTKESIRKYAERRSLSTGGSA